MEGGEGKEKTGCAPRLLGGQIERAMRRTGTYQIWVGAGKVHSAQQGLHLKLRQETEDSKVVIWILWVVFFNSLALKMKPSTTKGANDSTPVLKDSQLQCGMEYNKEDRAPTVIYLQKPK